MRRTNFEPLVARLPLIICAYVKVRLIEMQYIIIIIIKTAMNDCKKFKRQSRLNTKKTAICYIKEKKAELAEYQQNCYIFM